MFGPYVEHNKLRATLPRHRNVELTLEDGLKLLAEKAAKPTTRKGCQKRRWQESHCQEKSSNQGRGTKKPLAKVPKESGTVSDSTDPDRLASPDSLPSDEDIIDYVMTRYTTNRQRRRSRLQTPYGYHCHKYLANGVLARHTNRKIAAPDQLPEVCADCSQN